MLSSNDIVRDGYFFLTSYVEFPWHLTSPYRGMLYNELFQMLKPSREI